ncbi:MAG: thermonuclease family protein [Candidatus Shapirobacteria bacterium]|jgi:endonuclease YncB( thermonuclease family)
MIKEGELKKRRIPKIFWAGLILAGTVGMVKMGAFGDFRNNKLVFPTKTVVTVIIDGDTFTLKNGLSFRLAGVNAPDRNVNYEDYLKAKDWLTRRIKDKVVYLEYDRYLDEKFGRLTGYVWLGCESTPKFKPWNYMKKSQNESMPELRENPDGCKAGVMVNEELIKSGNGKFKVYSEWGKLKYQGRLGKD